MTDAMKRILPLLALVLVTACNSFRTQRYEDDLALPLAEGKTDTLLLSIDLEYAVKGLSPEALEQMNSVILTQAFDLEDSPGTLEETAVRYRENHIDGQFTERYRNWQNYLLSYYSFRGGAHGIQTISQIVFDRSSGAPLSETDLFAEGYLQPVAALMQEKVRSSMTAEAPELLELVEMDAIVPNGNFSVGKQGVEWIFQPYEAGPYALGIISAALDWEQLKPYLK